MWLAEPEIVDWEAQIGYAFSRKKQAYHFESLELNQYLNYIKDEICNINKMKADNLYVLNSDYNVIKNWSIFRCLYAEIEYDGINYVLRNGDWYEINQNFLKIINNDLDNIDLYDYEFPLYNKANEDEYNKFVSDSDKNIELMDKKFVFFGGGYSKNEHCDLIRNEVDLIHVKFYRGSSSMSHLFAQGTVSAEAFIFEKEYREKLNKVLPKNIKLKSVENRPEPKRLQNCLCHCSR